MPDPSGAAYAEVIGDPIAHSKSPLIHGFWIKRLGLDADYRACHVTADGLADYFAERRRDPDWRGCNITIPHKVSAMAECHAIDPLAERVGAVNTVVSGADGLTGFNTDVIGIVEALSGAAGGARMPVDLIGAGGAARAALVACREAGLGDITVHARDLAKAEALTDDLGIGAPAAMARLAGADEPQRRLIVNASPLGMTGYPPLAIALERYAPGSIAFDMVYAPLETPLLSAAKTHGLATIDGLSMLIGQAAAAFERFFGAAPPRTDDAALRRLLTA